MSDKKVQLDLGLLSRVISLASPYKNLLIATVILALLIAPISVLRPYLVNVMVDEHIMTGDVDGLIRMSFIFVGVILATVLLRYFFIYTTALLGQLTIKDLRVNIFQHIMSLRLRYFDQTPIGTATTRTINDIEAINSIFTQGMVTMIADILGIFAVIGVMFYTSWKLTLVALATLPLLLIATYIFKEKVKTAYNRVRTEIANMNAFLQERISGMRIVQIFNAEDREMQKFKAINRKYTQANLDSILYYAVYFPIVEIINFGTLALLVWFGARWFIDDHVSFGALVAFPMYLSMLYRPVRMLADKFNTLQMGLVAADRVFEVIDNKEQISNNGYIEKPSFDGKVSFQDVNFAYDEENYVIHDLSLDIAPGETLAIVGSTGSGKTTIINILNRFYEIQKGDILIDDKSIKEYKLEDLRDRIAIVLQDVFLFTGSVMDNITLLDPTKTKDQVLQASKNIGAHEFIERMPGGYNFEITERGSNLSMGQRQLISFVRALVFDPDILILDEATSSVDTETEAVIQYAIEKLIEKRTSIIIAHRLSTIRHADKILVMDQGKMLEYGTHEELLLLPEGKYKDLYEMQFNATVVV